MSAAIGYHTGGLAGALTAGVAMCMPSLVLTAVVGSNWERFADSPWRIALQKGLAPVIIGLMAAGAYALARVAIIGPPTMVVASVVTVMLLR